MNTRGRRAGGASATPATMFADAGSDGMGSGVTVGFCQVRYRAVQGLVWRLFGGFVMIIVTWRRMCV